jgi:hypothetical protein
MRSAEDSRLAAPMVDPETGDVVQVLKRRLTGTSGEAAGAGRTSGGRRRPDLDGLPKSELHERAKALDIPGRSGMDKQELIRAIKRSA